MCHTSPASFLVWAVLVALLGAFLVFHLWSFDRFKCLKWNSGPHSGAFKRIMTYSYLCSVPMIVAYALGFAIIKYQEGYTFVPGIGIFPMPYQLWAPLHKQFIFPLYLLFSIAWSLEMVTHLEELCFWLFLINAGSAHQDWFNSPYFKTWIVGSICAVTYMPLITIFTRDDPIRCEAFTFLGGSLGSLSLTVWFTPILWTFPSFLKNLRSEGVDIATVVRLTKFHELNTLRIVFRFMFVIPLLILAIDGVRPHPTINLMMVSTDILAMLAGIGCVVSSAITLVIFFPRSIENEIAARDAAEDASREKRMQRSLTRSQGRTTTQQSFGATQSYNNTPPAYTTPPSPKQAFTASVSSEHSPIPPPSRPIWKKSQADYSQTPKADSAGAPPPPRPRRWESDHEYEVGFTEMNGGRRDRAKSKLNPLVHNFTSPIDIAYAYASPDAPKEPRYTFTQTPA